MNSFGVVTFGSALFHGPASSDCSMVAVGFDMSHAVDDVVSVVGGGTCKPLPDGMERMVCGMSVM